MCLIGVVHSVENNGTPALKPVDVIKAFSDEGPSKHVFAEPTILQPFKSISPIKKYVSFASNCMTSPTQGGKSDKPVIKLYPVGLGPVGPVDPVGPI